MHSFFSKALRPFAVVLAVVSVTQGGLPAPAQASAPAPALQLVEAVGLGPHLELLYRSYRRHGEDGLDQAQDPAERAFFRNWRQAVDIFAPESLKARIAEHLQRRLGEDVRTQVQRFYASPLGRKVSAIEAAENNLQSKTRFMFQMMLDPGAMMNRAAQAPERLGLCKKLNATLESRDFAALIAAHSAAGNRLAESSGARGINREMLQAMVAEKLSAGKASSGFMGTAQVLQQFSAYRDLDTAELKKYMAFLRSPAGASFNAAIYASVNEALGEALVAFHRHLTGVTPVP